MHPLLVYEGRREAGKRVGEDRRDKQEGIGGKRGRQRERDIAGNMYVGEVEKLSAP